MRFLAKVKEPCGDELMGVAGAEHQIPGHFWDQLHHLSGQAEGPTSDGERGVVLFFQGLFFFCFFVLF